MLKKYFISFVAVALMLTSYNLVFPENVQTVSASCKNPYSGALAKYNPCVTHKEVGYISARDFASAAGAHYVAGAGLTHSAINKGLKTIGLRLIPGSQITWGADALNFAGNQVYLSAKKRNIKGWTVTYQWRYQTDALKDGGGIPKKRVHQISYTAVFN
ncbi:hypothetical protein [Alkalihalobacterium sp. APHAB7]|uniref:hypothetical protein n=1 Tax=Alkalihalobacterium sp. APHAB7 TaxID=3402081 RepID=UPI003AAF524F